MKIPFTFLLVVFAAGIACRADEDDVTKRVNAAEAAIFRNLKELGITPSGPGGELTIALPAALETDATLEKLQGLTRLACLYLHKEKITDAGLAHLKGLKNLETLWLIDANITDRGLQHIKDLTALKSLHLAGTRFTYAGLEHLR